MIHLTAMAERHLSLLLVSGLVAAATVTACAGIDAGIDYPNELPDVSDFVVTPENEKGASISFGGFKFKNDVCKGIDTHTITQPLNQEDFTRFVESQGLQLAPKKARSDLYWYDVPHSQGSKSFLRLRLAILGNGAGAAQDLHATLLEHGPGWWGVRRSNLAILAPKADLDDAAAFAVKHKLICWGMFTYAGIDDAYVVPGPYMEL
jgi:hypothetical protein